MKTNRNILYHRYRALMRRCYDPKFKTYRFYGGRGVIVCDEWKNNFEAFYNWAINNGFKKELHLDKDIKGNGMLYSPETCSFVEPMDNFKHKRKGDNKSLYFDYNGVKMHLKDICEIYNISYFTVFTRWRRSGYSENVLNFLKPSRYNYKNKKS